jgi:hypothetical protein
MGVARKMTEIELQYKFTIDVTGSNNTYTATGDIDGSPGDFIGVCERAMCECFQQLTSGRAIFGKPGVGCQGSYQLTRFTIEIIKQ